MNKKIFIALIIIVLIFVVAIFSLPLSNQNFDGLFRMNVPLGKHYSDTAYCWSNGGLGSAREYWEDNAGCDIEDGDIVVYYYDSSILGAGESNAFQHAVDGLTTSYLYKAHREGDLIILTNDPDMTKMPPYLAGVSNEDGSEAVFVGGRSLDDVKRYANTVEFGVG